MTATPVAAPSQATHDAPDATFRVVGRRFLEQQPVVPEPERARYNVDFVAEHRLPMRPDLHGLGLGNTFGLMGDALLDEGGLRGTPADAVVLVHRGPDVDVTELTAWHLAEAFTGDPDAFSISNDGVGAPFRALEYAVAQSRDEDHPVRLVLVVAEQTAALWVEEPGVDRPLADSAVVVDIVVGGARTVRVDQYQGAPRTLAALHAARADPRARIAVGRGAGRLLGCTSRGADAVCTAAWLDLVAQGVGDGPVVVADHDAVTDRGHVVTIGAAR